MSSTAKPSRQFKRFFISLSLVVLLVVSAIYAGLAVSDQSHIEAELVSRGRAIFGSIVLVRKWNASHGGVFVVKKPGEIANPYLENPDRLGSDGVVYTLKNPALMTREISELADNEGAFRFHIASNQPLNPHNAPDPFERSALEAFAHGAKEVTTREESASGPRFRYMGPLKVEKECLSCHAKQGYVVGDVRGGISVTYSMAEADEAMTSNRIRVGSLFTLTIMLLLAVIWRLVTGLHGRLSAAEAKILELASHDELTGIANRREANRRLRQERARALRQLKPLSVVLIDMDHFKEVNDAEGHDAGDAVLRASAKTAEAALRVTDCLGRWGGEEFLAILPETTEEGARRVVERVRSAVEQLNLQHNGHTLKVTLSAGVACWSPTDTQGPNSEADALVKLADEALYRAKAAGRNRVEVARVVKLAEDPGSSGATADGD